MQDEYLKSKVCEIKLKLDSSWKKLVISNFDEGAEELKEAVGEINEIADYSIKKGIKINLESKKISSMLHKINECFEKHQYIEAADIIKYKLIRNINNIN